MHHRREAASLDAAPFLDRRVTARPTHQRFIRTLAHLGRRDACPAVIKDILYRAAERLQIPLTLVANKPLRIPPSRFIRTLQVLRGFDVADKEIAQRVQSSPPTFRLLPT